MNFPKRKKINIDNAKTEDFDNVSIGDTVEHMGKDFEIETMTTLADQFNLTLKRGRKTIQWTGP